MFKRKKVAPDSTTRAGKKLFGKLVKEQEPQYFSSATNSPAYNYNVYHMSLPEKIGYFLIAFIVGAAVGYLFYGGLARNEFGRPTQLTYLLDLIICSVAGLFAGLAYLPIRTEQIIRKRKNMLKSQFRDMLDSLATSVGAGKNVPESFKSVYEDLSLQYEEGAFILNELKIILDGYGSNINIEEVLKDFGRRSGCKDIESFADVFEICYGTGGNFKNAIRNTHNILSEKMEIGEDIETVITSSKLEQNMMLIMPVVLVAVIKISSPEFAQNFRTLTGIYATTAAIACFVCAYYIGKHTMNFKI